MGGMSVSTFVDTGSLYTGNELGKCLVALYISLIAYMQYMHARAHGLVHAMILLFDMWNENVTYMVQ